MTIVDEPEVVVPSAAVEKAAANTPTQASAAIIAASDAALNHPGSPGAAEFLALAQQARILSLSGAAPKAIRENPYIAFHVALIGRDFGLSVAAAAELVDIIEGQNGPRISLSPQLLNGQIRRLGLGSIIPVQRTPVLCIAAALGPAGEYDERCKAMYPEHHDDCRCRGVLGTSMFSWESAQMAGLAGLECEPGEHKTTAQTRRRKDGTTYSVTACGCNQGYITYPDRMLWWRASGFAGDDYFPEASLGLYTSEALGAPTDENGRAIDPATVELPEGYEPKPDPRAIAKAEREAADAVPADELALLDLAIRAAALPDAQREQLREKWREHDHLAPHKMAELPAGRLRFAQALVSGFESAARSATRGTDSPWDVNTARATVVSALAALVPPDPAAQEPQDGPEDDPGPQGPDGPDASQGDDPGTPSGDTAADPEEPTRPKHVKDDGALVITKALLDDLVDAAPQEMVDRLSAHVKALHHSKVDTILREHGEEDLLDSHIDTRRMMACALLIADEMSAEEP